MLIGILKRLGRQLLYGGSKPLRGYETAVVDVPLAALPASDREVLAAQVDARERVQRWNSDRMVLFGFASRDSLPPLSVTSENCCLAKVKLTHASGRLTASVMTHRGFLSSVEFSSSPTELQDAEVRVDSVKLHSTFPGYSASIDREEH